MLTLRNFQEIAKSKNGKCLSSEYVGIFEVLSFECAKEHIFALTGNAVKNQGRWCPICSNNDKKLPNEHLTQLAKEHRGYCLNYDSYKGVKTVLEWQCESGHIFVRSIYDIKYNNLWCPDCPKTRASKRLKHTREEIAEIAEARGGRLISNDYLGTNVKHWWECDQKHQWESKPCEIMLGAWCPFCKKSKSEEVCRAFFEQLFEKHFPPATPAWLVNLEGEQLYLDGFCEELKIAFEHQGMQHYKNSPFFKYDFEKLKSHDQLKEKLCEQNGVTLVCIPALFRLTKLKDLKDLIKIKCAGKIPPNFNQINPSLVGLKTIRSNALLVECQKLAMSKAGICLSTEFISSNTPMRWQCELRHQWDATYESIKRYWCRVCAFKRKEKYSIETCYLVAELNGGRCLSTVYKNVNSRILLECEKQHQWETEARKLFSGSWCLKCKRPRDNNACIIDRKGK